MTATLLFRRLTAVAALATLAFGFVAAPVSFDMSGAMPSLKQAQAFARQGADDPAGHIRKGRGRDDAPGDDRGGVRGGGKDDAAGDDRGGKTRGGDKGERDDHGENTRGGGDDGPSHK